MQCNRILDQCASQKKRHIRGNQSLFMNNALSKAIMLKSKFRNTFLKNKNQQDRNNYSRQRNLFAILLQKRKREYFENLDVKNLCDNKKFGV